MFIFYQRKKTRLEIEKLELEIDEIKKKGDRIYIPSTEELIEIQKKIDSGKTLGFTGTFPVREFENRLHHFITELRAWLGDNKAHEMIIKERFQESFGNYQVPFSKDITKPNFASIINEWSEIRDLASRKFSYDKLELIDSLILKLQGNFEIQRRLNN